MSVGYVLPEGSYLPISATYTDTVHVLAPQKAACEYGLLRCIPTVRAGNPIRALGKVKLINEAK